MEESTYSMEEIQSFAERVPTLNPMQKEAFEQIMDAVNNNIPKIFFVDGPGGSGKTYLYNTVLGVVRKQGKIALAVASSGIAAMLLHGGRTAHSRFKISINSNDCSCSVHRGSQLAELFCSVDLIIWDEAPMSHKNNFEAVDRMLRDIRQINAPFGGVTVVFGGDFRQILPVIVKGTRAQIVNASLKRWVLWESVKILFLITNERLGSDYTQYADFLMEIGEGVRLGTIVFPEHMVEVSLESLILSVYPDFEQNARNPTYLAERCILATRNDIVEDINQKIISRLDSDSRIYSSSDTLIQTDGLNSALYPPEFLNSLDLHGCPPHKLCLKVGSPIILIRNLDASRCLCNGTRMIVTHLMPHLIGARISVGQNQGLEIMIPRIDFIPESELPFQFKRRQFPVRVCYAMTINRSQGQSIQNVGVYLPQPVFTHGQLYVALSRVTNSENIKVCVQDPDKTILASHSTINVVYKEIFE